MKAVAGLCFFLLMTAVLLPTVSGQQFQPAPRPLIQDPVIPGTDREGIMPSQTSQQTVNGSGDLAISSCGVHLIEDVDVPAREPGQIVSIDVREGDVVAKGGVIARIDDRLARRQLEESTFKHKIADTKAKDLTKIEGAQNLSKYAQVELNRTEGLYYKGSESEQKLNEARTNLELKRLDLSSAETERNVAEIEAMAEIVRLNAAQDAIERHELVAPIGGQVFEIFHQQGEWVMAGDKVFRIARMDKLRVKGRVDSRHHNPADVANRRVTVVAGLAGGKTVTLNGQITFVAMEKGGGPDEFEVWAEVENQQENGFWILLSGSSVDMTIHLNENAPPVNHEQVSGPTGNRPSTGPVTTIQ